MSQAEPYVLIVDDEADACHNLADISTELGHRVDVAHDGPSALKLVEQNAYDVALLDLKMPGMDGVELYRRIKSIRAGTVAIVVTAFAGSQTAQAARDAGAAEVLAKPVDLRRLMNLLDETLEQPLVLMIDDDPELCDSLWDVLRQQHYRVSLAHDLVGAKRMLSQGDYHVTLIDMKLPDSNGVELLQLVHRLQPAVRSIIITGHRNETEQLIEQALSQGASAVAYKPFDIPNLLHTLKDLAAQQSAKSS